ncbi:DUF4435 domain-containing protein [Lysobacter enzymogenes]|uniref:DUF4435 domain-containing protein n=1 Tax=Lysobacter enzymogenes TaxID=69 RepID=UPI000943729D|nr:DUF4435 domain-containing protein [Lysobacter enzymogenes]
MLVFVVEGKDDLVVYDIWLRRVSPDLKWEPLVARGKGSALEFREMLLRDRTGLRTCTYFIVDHDYDGLRGAHSDSDIYISPAYSFENFLVHPDVLDSLLKADIYFSADPSARAGVIDKYLAAMNDFVACVLPASFVLHGAVGRAVGGVNIWDAAVSSINISLDTAVVRDAERLERLVRTENPVPAEAIEEARDFFSSINSREWIRGKFLYHFFKVWVHLVYNDVRSARPTLHHEQVTDMAFTPASLDYRSLAARAPLPAGLAEFVLASDRECRANCS